MNSILHYLKNKRLVWQAHQNVHSTAQLDSTGFKELDAELQGGFPKQGVVDIDSPVGIGELRLLLPNLHARQQSNGRLLVFIAPSMRINSEMLAEYGFNLQQVLVIHPDSPKEALWCAEQCLKSGCCQAVLLWHQAIEIHQVKRLQLAAEQGDALHVLLRQNKQVSLSLPVSLGMRLRAHPQGLNIEITKRKGGWPGRPFNLDMNQQWPQLTIQPRPDNVLPFPHSKVS